MHFTLCYIIYIWKHYEIFWFILYHGIFICILPESNYCECFEVPNDAADAQVRFRYVHFDGNDESAYDCIEIS